jgi:hypothetical protein
VERALAASLCPLLAGLAGAGCVVERRLFDVEIVVHEAESLVGALDDDGLTFGYTLIPDRGDENGTDVGRAVIAFAPDPAATTLAVALDGFDADFARVAGGRSAALPLPDEGGVLEVPLLLAPAAVDVLTSSPPAPGPDACVVDDGRGRVFVVGGSASTQQAYAFDDAFAVRSLGGADFPAGVAAPGCGATAGVVAVVGGCSDGFTSVFIEVITATGERSRLDTDDVDVACGAAAAPRRDGAVWLVDGDHSVHLVDSTGGREIGPTRTGVRRGLEVTANDAVVFIVDDTLLYGSDDGGVVALGPATALGRRGDDVLVLDPDGGVGVVEAASVRSVRAGIDVDDVQHFVLLDDDTLVLLRRDGLTLDVHDADGVVRSLPTGVAGLTRVAALPGGTVVVGGADVAGLRAVSIR